MWLRTFKVIIQKSTNLSYTNLWLDNSMIVNSLFTILSDNRWGCIWCCAWGWKYNAVACKPVFFLCFIGSLISGQSVIWLFLEVCCVPYNLSCFIKVFMLYNIFSAKKSPVLYFFEKVYYGNSVWSTTTIGDEKGRERVYDTIFRLPWRCELVFGILLFNSLKKKINKRELCMPFTMSSIGALQSSV